jgi:dUTP pyrophosphatase
LAGVIDSWYRWDIWVIMINFGNEPLQINQWDKIAQFIIEKCHEVMREEVSELPESQRGEWWWWSTWK